MDSACCGGVIRLYLLLYAETWIVHKEIFKYFFAER